MSALEQLENCVRQRGVRVDERLDIIRVLKASDAATRLVERRAALMKAVKMAAEKLRDQSR